MSSLHQILAPDPNGPASAQPNAIAATPALQPPQQQQQSLDPASSQTPTTLVDDSRAEAPAQPQPVPSQHLPTPPPPPSAPPPLPETMSSLHSVQPLVKAESGASPMPVERDGDAREQVEEQDAATPVSKIDTVSDEVAVVASGSASNKKATLNVSSVYAGNKIKHLKKEDGIPLWRKDIQFDFLCNIFHDTTKCFTKFSDKTPGHTFMEVYVDAMASSSKCSKTVATKLLEDPVNALSMAMVCLLINVGRMNTTLNFFPEMRAQLRTYHSIPALQAHQDPNAYRQLQDAPRLKSILKGAAEDSPQPTTVEGLRSTSRPRTNPVNLIFIMSQLAPKITDLHFNAPRDFHDLIMRQTLSSKTRAQAFLWLIWWYMESDYTSADSLRNPFGPGRFGEDDDRLNGVPERIPPLESLTEEQAALENVDPPEELHFGNSKRKERSTILATEPSPAMTALKRARKKDPHLSGSGVFPSDDERSDAGWTNSRLTARLGSRFQETGSDYTRSPSPAGERDGLSAPGSHAKPGGGMRVLNLLNDDDLTQNDSPPPQAAKKGPGRGNWRRPKPTKDVPLLPNNGQLSFVNEGPDTPGSSFAQNNSRGRGSPTQSNAQFHNSKGDHVPTPSYQAQKRVRGITQHQSAVITHRKRQIDYMLDRRIRRIHARAELQREEEGPLVRAYKRVRQMPVDYDSEEELAKALKKDVPAKEEESRTSHKGKEPKEGKESKDSKESKENRDEPNEEFDGFYKPRLILGGLASVPTEPETVGEEAKRLAKAFQRCERRLERWTESDTPGFAMQHRLDLLARGIVLAPAKKKTIPEDDDMAMPEVPPRRHSEAKPSKKKASKSSKAAKATKRIEDENGGLYDDDREMMADVERHERDYFDDEMDED